MERSESKRHQVCECLEDPSVGPGALKSWAALGYVLPFVVFIVFLVVGTRVPVPQVVRFVSLLVVLAIFSRGLLPFPPSRFLSSVLIGIGVFFLWIGPDLLFPGYRNSILFSNAFVGHPLASTVASDQVSTLFLIFRVLVSVVIVPVIEELFWRGWMMRWIAKSEFYKIPIGTYHAEAFWIVAILFASEHGSYWDVGLVTGVIYNWWAVRTKNLTDCVIAHAVTNACLAIYVISWGQWQYWL